MAPGGRNNRNADSRQADKHLDLKIAGTTVGKRSNSAEASSGGILIAGKSAKHRKSYQSSRHKPYEHSNQAIRENKRSGLGGLGIAGKSVTHGNKQLPKKQMEQHSQHSEPSNGRGDAGISIWGSAGGQSTRGNGSQTNSKHSDQKDRRKQTTDKQSLKPGASGISIKQLANQNAQTQGERTEKKKRSLFGYHMSQVVHQDNMDRLTSATAGLPVGDNGLADAVSQFQPQHLLALARGLADLAAAAAAAKTNQSTDDKPSDVVGLQVPGRLSDLGTSHTNTANVGSLGDAILEDDAMDVVSENEHSTSKPQQQSREMGISIKNMRANKK